MKGNNEIPDEWAECEQKQDSKFGKEHNVWV